MTDLIAALPSPTQPIRHESDSDGVPETESIAFNELWQDKESGPTFGDLLDIVNPLQHIPVVSTIYRMVTGDEIGVGARMLGGALFGGAIGVAAAGIVAGLEEVTGGTVEQHVASLFGLDDGSDAGAAAPAGPMLASAAPQPAGSATVPPESIPSLTTEQAAALLGARVFPAAGGPSAPSQSFPAAPPQADVGWTFPARPVSKFAPPVPQSAKTPEEVAAAAPQPDEEAARLKRKIAAAQRAQAGLLIANLQATGAVPTLSSSAEDRAADRVDEPGAGSRKGEMSLAQPGYGNHPYMLPPGAPSALVAKTMERALQRYHQSLQRQTAELPPPPVAVAPAALPPMTPANAGAR